MSTELAGPRAIWRSLARASTGSDYDPDRLDRRDVGLIRACLPYAERFNRTYLRLRVEGLEHLPRGPALLVANHNGGIMGPDLSCTLASLWLARGPEAPLFALAHDFAMAHLTPLGRMIQPFGAVRATRRNALRALETGAQVLVYPGGDLDAFRPFARRHEVVLGSRSGFVSTAREAGVPIVPVVAHGAHRSAVILSDGGWLARALGVDRRARITRFPIALALPWIVAVGPLPYLPLPFAVTLRVLPPVDPHHSRDADAVRESVRASMERTLRELSRAND
jgi:1-acyl-sn-glycerol-3-phosphate acyltransferase